MAASASSTDLSAIAKSHDHAVAVFEDAGVMECLIVELGNKFDKKLSAIKLAARGHEIHKGSMRAPARSAPAPEPTPP